jgi:hypothetical protein
MLANEQGSKDIRRIVAIVSLLWPQHVSDQSIDC